MPHSFYDCKEVSTGFIKMKSESVLQGVQVEDVPGQSACLQSMDKYVVDRLFTDVNQPYARERASLPALRRGKRSGHRRRADHRPSRTERRISRNDFCSGRYRYSFWSGGYPRSAGDRAH